MKIALRQPHPRIPTQSTIIVFDESKIDDIIKEVLNTNIEIYRVEDAVCSNANTLCNKIESMRNEGRFLTLNDFVVPTM